MTSQNIQTLAQLNALLGKTTGKIKIHFKANRVTVGCRHKGHSYGTSGLTLAEALQCLQVKMPG